MAAGDESSKSEKNPTRLRREAEALANKGQLDAAIRAYQDLVEADPDNDRAWRELADLVDERASVRLSQGKKRDAADEFETLADLCAGRRWYGRAIRACREAQAIDADRSHLGKRLSELRRGRLLAVGRALGLALLSTVLMVAAAPPRGFWPLGLVAFAPLYWAVRQATTPLRAAAIAWICYFPANLAGFAWGIGLLERFAHVSLGTGVLALAVACAYHALVGLLWAWLTSLLCRRWRLSWVVVAPLTMALVEALVPMIFPWYLAILVWRAWPLVQIAEVGGPPAVSALVVLIGALVAETTAAALRREWPGRAVRRGAIVTVAIVLLGALRVAQVASARDDAPTLRVGIVQPNFGITSIEARSRHGQQYIETLRAATEEAGNRGAELVLWPESAFPFYFDRDLPREYAPGHPWELRAKYRGRLLFGALAHPFGESYIFNSAILVSADGAIAGIYDKNRLLIFGEYIPLADRYPDWAKRMRDRLPDWPEIRPGDGPKVLVDGDLRVVPLICYEDILPGYVHAAVRMGHPNLLVTLANHAWFGNSAAGPEALALATYRSIETRRDLVRATNTGVSSFGDALGRVSLEGPIRDIPRDQPGEPEIFVRDVRLLDMFALGPYTVRYFPYACALALVVMLLVGWRRRRAVG